MEAPITTEKVEILKKTILENPIFEDKGISLPPITDAMIVEIAAGGSQCQTAIEGLVKNVQGTSLKEDFNDLATDPNLIDGAMACMEGIRTKPLWETDGHYSTVYLVALTLGIDENLARDLAKYTEQPDTYVHSEYDYELNETWIYPWQQAESHALTNGFHGVEEMITALKFLNTPNTDLQELGRLLHRYGDTYAHTEIPNTDDWSTVPDVDIYKHIDPWMKLINDGIITDGLKFLNDEDLQKKQLQGYTFAEYLNFIYLEHKSDKFRMYGDRVIQMIPFTKEHFSTPEKSQPDYIWVRPRWYYLYVKNLAKILSLKYNITKPFDATVFEQMLGYASKNKSKLKGIIDYEIAKKLNKNYFIVPVFYAGDLFFANIDKLLFTDYMKEAKDAKDNALKYIQSISPNAKIEVIEIKGNMNLNSSCFYNTLAYKIYFK